MTTAMEIRREDLEHLELIALNRPQLEAAHAQMVEWARNQIALMRDEMQEAEENAVVARSQRWATETYERRIAICRRRVVFYEKIEAAIAAGYVIVPNFPMDVFAIRTKRHAPKGNVVEHTWGRFEFTQAADILPAGEGEYRNPSPAVDSEKEERPDGKGGTKSVILSWPTEFRDIAFPVALAKPAIMSKTAEAMSAKLFDEIGIAQDRSTGGDPMILGRLRNPRRNSPSLTFFVAWYLDPSRI